MLWVRLSPGDCLGEIGEEPYIDAFAEEQIAQELFILDVFNRGDQSHFAKLRAMFVEQDGFDDQVQAFFLACAMNAAFVDNQSGAVRILKLAENGLINSLNTILTI